MKNKFESGRNKPKPNETTEHIDGDSIEIDENAEREIKLEETTPDTKGDITTKSNSNRVSKLNKALAFTLALNFSGLANADDISKYQDIPLECYGEVATIKEGSFKHPGVFIIFNMRHPILGSFPIEVAVSQTIIASCIIDKLENNDTGKRINFYIEHFNPKSSANREERMYDAFYDIAKDLYSVKDEPSFTQAKLDEYSNLNIDIQRLHILIQILKYYYPDEVAALIEMIKKNQVGVMPDGTDLTDPSNYNQHNQNAFDIVSKEFFKLLQKIEVEKNLTVDTTSQPDNVPPPRTAENFPIVQQAPIPSEKELTSALGVTAEELHVGINKLEESVKILYGDEDLTRKEKKEVEIIKEALKIFKIVQRNLLIYNIRERNAYNFNSENVDSETIVTYGSDHDPENEIFRDHMDGVFPPGFSIYQIQTDPTKMGGNEVDYSKEPLDMLSIHGKLMEILNNKDLPRKVRNHPFFKFIMKYSLLATENYDTIFDNFEKLKKDIGIDANYIYHSVFLAYKTGHLPALVYNRESIEGFLTDENVSPEHIKEVSDLIDKAEKHIAELNSGK